MTLVFFPKVRNLIILIVRPVIVPISEIRIVPRDTSVVFTVRIGLAIYIDYS